MAKQNFIARAWGGLKAAVLPPLELPKAPKGEQALPGYRTNIAARAGAIPKPVIESSTLDRLGSLRQQSNTYSTLREIMRYSPEVGSAISATLRTAIPENYTLFARDMDGQISEDGTKLVHELIRRLTFMGAADGTFKSQQGIQSLSESLVIDAILNGALAGEVALDKQLVPSTLNPVAVNSLVFYDEDKSFRIVQRVGGDEIDLDIPTFIYVTMDQVLTEAYPTSPLFNSVQPVVADLQFTDDTRKALRRAVLPRLVASIDSEAVRKQTPPAVLGDPAKLKEYNNNIIESAIEVINGLNPEDALVSYDYVTYKYVDGGHDPSQIIERVQKVLNAKLVSGAKALPVTLGFAQTNGASSAESLLFMKHCNGYRKKLNEFYSRALTVAIRIMGVDGFVEFEFEELNLKPTEELEAFKAMKQSRILELNSLGYMSDMETSIRLTGHLPPEGMQPLAGTMFKHSQVISKNPLSNTANATERSLSPDTPTSPKS